MQKIRTTTNPLEAARLLNQGNTGLSIRDTKTGRFVGWRKAKEFDFGVNGQPPLSYDHLKKELTLRANFHEIKDVMENDTETIPLFLTSGGIICDGKIPIDDFPSLWRTLIKPEYLTVFEVYR